MLIFLLLGWTLEQYFGLVIIRIITSLFRLVDKKTDYWLLMFLFPLPSHSPLPTMHSLCAKLVLNTPWCSQLKQSRSIGGHGLQQNPNHGVTHTIIYCGFKLSKLLHILFIIFFVSLNTFSNSVILKKEIVNNASNIVLRPVQVCH